MKHAVKSQAGASPDWGNLASAIVMGDAASPSTRADVIYHHLNNAIHGNVRESDEILMGLGITPVLLHYISFLHHSEALIITWLISLLHYQCSARSPLDLVNYGRYLYCCTETKSAFISAR